jgi:hypothetical protein
MLAGKRKAKIAVSLDEEVLELLDRHASGRSRSRCVQEELLRALRAREWERLSAQLSSEEQEEQLAWARASYARSDEQLSRGERPDRRGERQRRKSR